MKTVIETHTSSDQSSHEPEVSVIIPVFNGAKYIKEAIECVLNQTFKDFEIIVVDDGSTDNTRCILETWINEGRLRYIYQQNKGLAGARNTGIRLARGKFLKFLDSDDILYPQQLEYQVNHLKDKHELIISVTDYEIEFASKTKKRIKIRLTNRDQLAKFIDGNPCPSNVILVRRSFVQKLGGFDEELSSHEDTDLWLRALVQGSIFEQVDYVGCCYRIFETSLSGNEYKMFINLCKVSEKINKTLLLNLHTLNNEVLQSLLLANSKLVSQCFARDIRPKLLLPLTLETSNVLYFMLVGDYRKLFLRILGIQNVVLLKYLKNCLTNKHYRLRLIHTAWWRDERNYL